MISPKTVRVFASSFEIERSEISEYPHEVAGYLELDIHNETAFEALKDLSSKETVEKIIVVYKNYEFSLEGVSFEGYNVDPLVLRLGNSRNYKFRAKDVHLELSSQS